MYNVYILRLSDGSLYCGVTKDLNRRLKEHRQGRGSKYVKGRLPLELVYLEKRDTIAEAMNREAEIKGWTKKRKENLVKSREKPRG
ncbi:hypothetical protein AKJ57_06025 [candidate division MSBL1 archaeon SCGC-AAA259A05]|uniref:GIY-YIG domain-containing protein n=1 Tax=candidate division MSBL1 archaeon SCGC-AAA259A05 TaxID=1698259 RepID=A0A133U468_9EURY|nr:hypothetical protein AKJ57_06025 [candidate division MSBL1 archaeon SCGC-AAA259A05]